MLRARNKDTRATLPAKYGFGYSVSGHSFYHYMRRFPVRYKN